jgi:hypothetical protein
MMLGGRRCFVVFAIATRLSTARSALAVAALATALAELAAAFTALAARLFGSLVGQRGVAIGAVTTFAITALAVAVCVSRCARRQSWR